jgi:exonuclease SbcD
VLVLHAADLHVDSPQRGLERLDGAPLARLRGATRKALSNLVELALEERASLLLLAGDLFDGAWRDVGSGLFLVRELSRLRDVGTRVVMVRGNHDAASVVSRHLPLPDHVRELSWEAPESVLFEELGVVVHGQGFATRAVTEDLARRYPPRVPGLVNVGLLHTALEGRPGHDPYAPTSLERLVAKDYDYWALGHVHEREVVSREPWVVFPGNLQGRGAREAGAKGATRVEIEGGRVARVEHVALDDVRWAVVTVDASTAGSVPALLDRVHEALGREAEAAGSRALVARVVLRGPTELCEVLMRDGERLDAEVRALAAGVRGSPTIERVDDKTRPALAPLAGLGLDGASALGLLRSRFRALSGSAEALSGLARELDAALERLPADLRAELGLTEGHTARLGELVDEAEALALGRLVEASE